MMNSNLVSALSEINVDFEIQYVLRETTNLINNTLNIQEICIYVIFEASF